MKSTLADNKQLFNVKAIAAAGLAPTAIPDGQFGVLDEATGLTVVPANFASLPERFQLISKLNGELYFSFDVVEKSKLKNRVAKDYVAQQINIWKTTIQGCACIDGVQLNLNIDEASLMQRDGLTWTHRDFSLVISPAELACYDCSTDNMVYQNNVYTMLLAKKVNDNASAFYEAEVQVSVAGLTTGATFPASPVAGDLYIKTGADAGLNVYSGTDWVLIGSASGSLTNVQAFVDANKAKNTDDDTNNNGPLLDLIIKGKLMTGNQYRDLDVNYVSPRGVKLNPAIVIDGKNTVPFVQTQALRYEIGAGYDMRAEEWENMNNYTTLNYYPRLSDGIQSSELTYQFENSTNYNTITFEFYTDKVERNNGDKRLFGVLLGTSVGGVYTSLKNMFGL